MIKIDRELIAPLEQQSAVSPRLRINRNFHELPDCVNRFLNVLQPGTYAQPHKHENPDRFEVFLVLKGKLAVFEFDDAGNIKDKCVLDPLAGSHGVEIAPCVWHTIVCLEADTVCYEVKEGPYDPLAAKCFASFAPAEGAEEVCMYIEGLIRQLF